MSRLDWAVMAVTFVGVDLLLVWAAGYVLAMEDWLGGQRRRFEEWAYVDAEAVRRGDDEADLFWDRAQPWRPRRWRYRGRRGMALAGVKGRRVLTRPAVDGRVVDGAPVLGPVRYGTPTLDDRRLGPFNFAATVARGKAADLWGCPICSGFWGALPFALAASAWGPWEFAVGLVLVLHVAAWGLARSIGWQAH